MKITKKNLEKLIIEELEALLSEQPKPAPRLVPVRDPEPEQPPGDPEQRQRRPGEGGSKLDRVMQMIDGDDDDITGLDGAMSGMGGGAEMMGSRRRRAPLATKDTTKAKISPKAKAKVSYGNTGVKEEMLPEGMLEDPIEQSGSTILSMLDGQGFRTRGFMESLVNTIKMEAEKNGENPIDVAEDELLKMRKGMDDLGDRIANRLMTYFPRGETLAAATARKTNED